MGADVSEMYDVSIFTVEFYPVDEDCVSPKRCSAYSSTSLHLAITHRASALNI
jgi:hypothetical protein